MITPAPFRFPTPLAHVTMGLGWDPVRRRGLFGRSRKDIDLNAAALMFAGSRLLDVAYHEKLTSNDGAARHLGDSVTGDGDGDNEVIVIDLTAMDPLVTTIVFVVSCYSGHTLDQVENGFCRITDSVTATQLIRCDLADTGPHTGIVIATLRYREGDWDFSPIIEPISARHLIDAIPHLGGYLVESH